METASVYFFKLCREKYFASVAGIESVDRIPVSFKSIFRYDLCNIYELLLIRSCTIFILLLSSIVVNVQCHGYDADVSEVRLTDT